MEGFKYSLATPLLANTTAKLAKEAVKRETKIANTLAYYLNKKNKDGKYDNILSYMKVSPSAFLKEIFLIALRTSKKVSTNLSYKEKKNGGIEIEEATYTIDNEIFHLSKDRVKELEDIYKRSKNENDVKDIYDRLKAIIWEEAGEKIINRMIEKSPLTNEKGDPLVAFSQSKDWKVDSTADLMITNGAVDWTDDLYGTFLKGNKIFEGRNIFNLEHKMNLENFHFGSGDIKINADSTGTNVLDRISIPDAIMSTMVKERVENYYPVYYSANTGDVMLSSEMLSNPRGFYLKEPKLYSEEEITKLALEIYDEIKEDSSVDFTQKILDKTTLSKEILDTITNVSYKTNMWYGRSR